MRREPAFLKDIFVSASRIQAMMRGVSRDDLLRNEILQAALLHHFTVIGEAVSRLPQELRARYNGVPWADIVALRNRIVHVYFGVDWQVLWAAALDDIPVLREYVTKILAEEFGELPPEPQDAST
jgi:uncharacterized protein with HEPN domain